MGCGASAAVEVPVTALLRDPMDEIPVGFPAGIEAKRELFQNWDRTVLACRVLQCYPKNEKEIEDVANWAVTKGWKVRATGVKHNWSLLTIPPTGPSKDLDGYVLINLMKHMKTVTVHPGKDGKKPTAVAQLGVRHLELLTALEAHKEGGTDDIGYGLIHTPAPDNITLGGMLAIAGHGTATPTKHESKWHNPDTTSFGTLSNLVLAVRALVWNASTKTYMFREFRRERGEEIAPFLTHVGRSIMSEATLQVEKNYYMSCESILNVKWTQMFPKPGDPKHPKPKSMAWHLKYDGRAEAIWFPFTDYPWLKVWRVTDNQPKDDGWRKVTTALNYPFSDDLGDDVTTLVHNLTGGSNHEDKNKQIKLAVWKDQQRMGEKHHELPSDDPLFNIMCSVTKAVGGPDMTPAFSRQVWQRVVTGLHETKSWKIWGPSKNTLIYVKDTTLRVTANGYAVMTSEDNVETAMYEFVNMYQLLLEKFKARSKYPICCPLEIRVTGVDEPRPIGDGTYSTPPMSALCYDEEAKQNGWNRALWLDVLSLPDAAYSNDFYVEMEALLMKNPAFNGTRGRIRPEWSKGWGYTKEGPWKNQSFLDHTRNALPRWNEMMAALERHDPKKLFSNPWMESFFVRVTRDQRDAGDVVTETPIFMMTPPNPALRDGPQRNRLPIAVNGKRAETNEIWSYPKEASSGFHPLLPSVSP